MLWGAPLREGCSPLHMRPRGVRLAFSCRDAYDTCALAFDPPAPYGLFYTVVPPLLRPPGATSALLVRGIGLPGCSRYPPLPALPGLSPGIANG